MFLEISRHSLENNFANFSFLMKLHRPQACNLIKKETLAQVFSCEFCEISKSTFSYTTSPGDCFSTNKNFVSILLNKCTLMCHDDMVCFFFYVSFLLFVSFDISQATKIKLKSGHLLKVDTFFSPNDVRCIEVSL